MSTTREDHVMYAHGFVWGLECGGNREARAVDSDAFAQAYADARVAADQGRASAPSVQDAFVAFRDHGTVFRPQSGTGNPRALGEYDNGPVTPA